MAVAHDTTSAAQSLSNQNTKSWSHTASGSDRLGIVALAHSFDTVTVSSITWGGVAMTHIGTATLTGSQKATLYYIIAPPTSSATVAVTFSGNVYGVVASMSFTGVSQTTPVGTAVTSSPPTAPSVSVNVSTSVGDMVVDCVKHYPTTDGSGNPVVGAGQTSRWAGDDGAFDENGAGSTETGSGTVTMSWTGEGADAWSLVAVNLLQSSGGGGTTHNRTIMRTVATGT